MPPHRTGKRGEAVPILPAALRAARKRARLTQEALGRLTGIPSKTVIEYESGRVTPTLRRLVTLAAAMGAEIDELLGWPAKRDIDLAGLGKRLRAERERRGLTQVCLSEAAGLEGAAVGEFERGRGIPHVRTLLAICANLGVRPSVLLCQEAARAGPASEPTGQGHTESAEGEPDERRADVAGELRVPDLR